MNKCYARFLAHCPPSPCIVDSFCVTFNLTGVFLTLDYDPVHHLLSPTPSHPTPCRVSSLTLHKWPSLPFLIHVSLVPLSHPGLQAFTSEWLQLSFVCVDSSAWKAISPMPGKPPSKSFKMQFDHFPSCPAFPVPQAGLRVSPPQSLY